MAGGPKSVHACGFPYEFDCAEVHMRGEVLFAWCVEYVVGDVVLAIGSQCPLHTRWREEFVGAQSVIQGQQPTFIEGFSCLSPPVTGGRAYLGDEPVRQDIKKCIGDFRPKES